MIYTHQSTKIFFQLSLLLPGLLSLFPNTSWHIPNVPFTCHNYLGNTHRGMNIFIWGGTKGDKACGISLLPIQIILHIKEDSIYMGKHYELTLDRIYIL